MENINNYLDWWFGWYMTNGLLAIFYLVITLIPTFISIYLMFSKYYFIVKIIRGDKKDGS